jgi:hypothetical protein
MAYPLAFPYYRLSRRNLAPILVCNVAEDYMSSIRKWVPPAAKAPNSKSPAVETDEMPTSKAVAVALFKRVGVLLAQGDYVKAAQLSGMLRVQLLAMSPVDASESNRANFHDA